MPPAGVWKGELKVPGSSLAIHVSLDRAEEGVWSGAIDIPAQGLRGFALAEVEVSGSAVGFILQGIPGTPTFEGVYEEEEQCISGDFYQGGQQLNFELYFLKDDNAADTHVSEKGIQGEGAVGEWFGELAVGPSSLRLALHIFPDGGDSFTGTMDSLDQGANGLKMDSITFDDGKLTYRIDRIGGSFEGILNEDGSRLEGVWMQGGQEMPLSYRRIAEPLVQKRTQDLSGPFPYEQRAVTFRNELDGLSFAGTFVVPEGRGPFSTVLFISGSGPQDRDESLMGHKPFAVIADRLARRGVASLRFDDRGVGGSEGSVMDSETTSFANDAIAAIRFLEKQEEVDLDALGLIGHSEGGLVGPMVAVQDEQLDFLVLLAPPGEPLDELILRQSADGLRLKGVDETLVQRIVRDTRGDIELIKDLSLSRDDLVAGLRTRSEEIRENYDERVLEELGFTDAAFENSLKSVSTKWFRSLMQIDPSEYLDRVTIPTLALFGERDVQVAAGVNADILRASFEKAGNRAAMVHVLPRLNHLFQNCDTGSIEEYGRIEETFDEATLQLIGDWILNRGM
ncbi:alpha/beta hydrolase [Pelagicoccus sp. SDUM812002]|uniref:alpha/beta hydrolase family protein n=1 Tax=Pelagicoccus sp. SDUM812002 TaxID=3041266 RepID=UPI00280DD1F1|nr:alpha/beta hydrolase [Pelagicoccus sp. SDUM812002]MDQ8185734.1 alpha/beta hydrolase [Pelagicoccus sp. SDUM812002]